ncbi:hypothetical protein ACL02S_05635 [Nocardia sp. 004]|uniref:hypothetical protein n=1 Tax=Nocardia sp. 004 TaxID=3385978 RepID=UPI0039A31621
MTSPDRLVPQGAYSGPGAGGEISGVSQITQDTAKSAMSSGIVQSFGNIAINFGAVIDAGVKEFAADLCDAITGATGGLIDLSGWAWQLRADADQALRDSVTAQRSASGAQSTADNQTVIIEATNSKMQVVIDGLPIKPYWETMNLTEETSFPRNLLHNAVWELSASGTTVSVDYTPAYTPPANTMEGAFIRCLYSGGRKVVSYIPDAVSSPCELYVVVGRMLDSGDIKIEWVSANQTPEITASRVERTIELPSELVFEQGETAFVGIHQRGSGNRRPLLGIEAADIPRPPTVWPPQLNAQFPTSSVLSAGVTLAAGTLDFTSRKIPYVSFGKSSSTGDPIKLKFFEDFESGGMPSALVRLSARVAKVSDGVFVVSGLDDGLRRYLYGQRLNYDDHMVTGRLRNPTDQGARLFVRSDAANSSYVSLTVTSGSLSIVRWTGGETASVLASVQTTTADNDEFRIKAVGDVFTAEKKIGGVWTQVLTHTDSGNALPKGSSYRYTGLGTTRYSWVNGGGWGDWKAEDL